MFEVAQMRRYIHARILTQGIDHGDFFPRRMRIAGFAVRAQHVARPRRMAHKVRGFIHHILVIHAGLIPLQH